MSWKLKIPNVVNTMFYIVTVQLRAHSQNNLINSKLRGTYSVIPNNSIASMSDTTQQQTQDESFLTMPLAPITNAMPYIDSEDYWLQQKFDGERRVLTCNNGTVTGNGRYGQPKPVLSDTIRSLSHLQAVFDCEAMPDHYRLFDLLSLNGTDITHTPFQERYQKLALIVKTLEDAPTVKLAHAHFTRVEKIAAFKHYEEHDFEGVVLKNRFKPYKRSTTARPDAGQYKYKFYSTASVIVGEKHKSKRSISINLLHNDSISVSAGNLTIPPNAEIPEENSIVEVRYLYATAAGKLYQPTLIRQRDDVRRSDCTVEQLKYRGD